MPVDAPDRPAWLTEVALSVATSLEPAQNALAFAEALVRYTPVERAWIWTRTQPGTPATLTVARPDEAGGAAALGLGHPAFSAPHWTLFRASHKDFPRFAAGTGLTDGCFAVLPLASVGILQVYASNEAQLVEAQALTAAARQFALAQCAILDSAGDIEDSFELWGEDTWGSLDAARMRSARFLEAVVENLPDMIFVKEADDLRFVALNKAGEELLGVDREEMLGKNDYDFFPQEEADFFTKKDREVLDAGVLVNIPEEPIHTRFKGTRHLHTKKIPIVDRDGRPIYLLGISEDITERKHAEEAMKRFNQELEERVRERTNELEIANAELEAFVHSVSHDLRSPLRSIHSFGEMLAEDCGEALGSEGQGYVERILVSCVRLEKLFDALMALSRISRSTLKRCPVDLSQRARRLLPELNHRYPHGVEVSIDLGLHCVADEQLIDVLLRNLLGNAFKFTREAENPKVSLYRVTGEAQPTFCVEDNGIGFDQTWAAALVRPFHRLHGAEGFEGTGIGLTTVQRITQRHGGRLWAQGEMDKGARFFFSLPEWS